MIDPCFHLIRSAQGVRGPGHRALRQVRRQAERALHPRPGLLYSALQSDGRLQVLHLRRGQQGVRPPLRDQGDQGEWGRIVRGRGMQR